MITPRRKSCALSCCAAGRNGANADRRGAPGEYQALLGSVPEALRQHGRVQLLEIEAGLAFGDLETVGRGLTKASRSSTTRKGDEILTDLWFRPNAERISRTEGILNDATLRASGSSANSRCQHATTSHDCRVKNLNHRGSLA